MRAALVLPVLTLATFVWGEPQNSSKNAFTRGAVGLYSEVPLSEQAVAAQIEKCKAHKINILLPSLSGGGTVVWKTDKADYYTSMREKLEAGYDGLAVLIKHAHAAGIKVYPSVAVCPGGKMLNDHPEWETRDRNGKPASATVGAAVSMAYPAARAAKVALLMDLVNGYEVDGVLLDYCRYPEGGSKNTPETRYGFFGYDSPLIDTCKRIYNFDPRETPIDSPRWQIFNRMRAETVTLFVREFREAVKATGKPVRVGGFGDTDADMEARACGRDWAAWGRQGLIDDFFLATYTESVQQMPEVVARARRALGPDAVLLSAMAPFQKFLKTNEEMEAAAKAQLKGGADGLWVYREDFLNQLDLWAGARAAADDLRANHR